MVPTGPLGTPRTPPGHPQDTPSARCCRLPILPVRVSAHVYRMRVHAYFHFSLPVANHQRCHARARAVCTCYTSFFFKPTTFSVVWVSSCAYGHRCVRMEEKSSDLEGLCVNMCVGERALTLRSLLMNICVDMRLDMHKDLCVDMCVGTCKTCA